MRGFPAEALLDLRRKPGAPCASWEPAAGRLGFGTDGVDDLLDVDALRDADDAGGDDGDFERRVASLAPARAPSGGRGSATPRPAPSPASSAPAADFVVDDAMDLSDGDPGRGAAAAEDRGVGDAVPLTDAMDLASWGADAPKDADVRDFFSFLEGQICGPVVSSDHGDLFRADDLKVFVAARDDAPGAARLGDGVASMHLEAADAPLGFEGAVGDAGWGAAA